MLLQPQVTPEEGLSYTSLIDRIAGNAKRGEEDEGLRGTVVRGIQWHSLDARLERVFKALHNCQICFHYGLQAGTVSLVREPLKCFQCQNKENKVLGRRILILVRGGSYARQYVLIKIIFFKTEHRA